MNDQSPLPDMLWSGLGLVAPLEARVTGVLPRPGIFGISIDSRSLQPGDLFFAIEGDTNDGHDFVHAAFENGAAAAVVAEARAHEFEAAGTLYIVHDVLAALERLGRAARARSKGKIIAVTGSVGKTSTKEALRLVLGEQGQTHASTASYNNHWGVPLTLATLPSRARFGVFEIGMNHAGEITPLAAMVRPHVAIVTTVAPVHTEFLGSVEAVADAKAEIFSGLEQGGVAVIHRDIPQFERLRERAEASPAGSIVSFGEHEEAEARLISLVLAADHSDITALINGNEMTYRLGAPGRHLAVNSLAVLAAVEAADGDVGSAAATLAYLAQPPGRGARVNLQATGGAFTLIDESYNANPVSMRAALAVLAGTSPGWLGRRIAVLGDMLELGPDAPALHAELAEAIAESRVDVVFAAGLLMQHLADAIPSNVYGGWAERAADIESAVLDAVHGGDVVMVKGSKGSRMSAIVAALRERYTAVAETGRP
ncbi:MAG: UDP-N-acetylmuramoylalanyl-D-glutamyl-2,6-diaminopimelate--D-alanyl-D-alanine ligase [Methylobacteriaceae bacterium]|nr:UDP-N-acetylmuramoylalanyl-D-glutamyl-2,6-diaminopimelate--D-alanyl-D-alanine ligase [Methylobacteriaceae bacterium]MBV9702716.1 UDP-N-acetylmuramoylalanyl-D-glutamyl-2,6-diaminopimelate--D-alanyl-D-alanine ligase [Methylobacteriaceae bacterium]